ncbi:MAG: UDP-N-acetylmuramate--L-alanine ligase [Flavobacteriales bacterium]
MNSYTHIYFIGIGGIGMSALARYFHAKKCVVAGYDKTSSQLTSSLIKEGIEVSFKENFIPNWVLENENTLIVYTPAVSENHFQLNFFRSNNYEIKKRSEVLGIISQNKFTIAVAGTHGKTTTSTILAHLLDSSSVGCTAFLGGISSNYNSNLLLSSNDIVVVEADEYDKSFLQLKPDIAIITSVDPDHLDVYKDSQDFKNTFIEFAKNVKPDGLIILNKSTGLDLSNLLDKNVQTYSALEKADHYAYNFRKKDNKQMFDVKIYGSLENEILIEELSLSLPGEHNIENALSTIIIANRLGVSKKEISKAFSSFKGIKRRFEIHQNNDYVFIDDYAHHPQEIKATLLSAKTFFPNKKMTVVFQPHLFSRTNDFFVEFGQSLSIADEVILLDIFPAREQPIKDVDSSLILDKVNCNQKNILSKKELLNSLKDKRDLLITLGAGDISKLVEPINSIYL